jgi:hypothetical protein
MNDKKQESTETELIAWAIPQIAGGNYFITDRASGRELRISLARLKFPNSLKTTLDDADVVREKANDAVHKGSPDTETCKNMFIKTRGILRELYSMTDNS